MKSRVLGLACAASLAAGCQSSAARALSRYEGSHEKAGEIAQASHQTPAGLPGASNRRTENTPASREAAFEMGEKSLQQFYRDRQDKPAHLQRARVNFEAAAKADPTFAPAQHRLAIIADLQERFRESEGYYRTALSLDPENPNIAADLGWSFILQERWQDAERALQRALELDPHSTIARDHLAKCRQHLSTTLIAGNERPSADQMLANRPASVGAGSNSSPPQNWAQSAPPIPQRTIPGAAPDHTGEYLRNQLAQIDQHGRQPAGQPVTIPPRQPAAPMQAGQQWPDAGHQVATQGFGPPQYGGNTSGLEQAYRANPPHEVAYASRSEPRPTQAPFVHIEPGASAPAISQPQMPPPYGSWIANGDQRGPGAEWSSGRSAVQQTQAVEAPAPPNQAVYQSPQFPSVPGQTWDGARQYFDQRASSGPSTSPSAVSAQEKARRDAALMGLGLGPGQYFPTLEQPTATTSPDRMSAGSNSHLSGAAFGAPPIHAPDLTPPVDLKQMPSFFEQSAMTPPANSMGQTMPGGTSSMMTPGSVNDPNARFQQNYVNQTAGQMPQPQAAPNVWSQSGMSSGMQGYDEARRAADLQLQQTLQNTWSNSPANAIPSPAGGAPQPVLPPQSQMMNEGWGRQPVAPPPYPQAAPPQAGRSFDPQPLPSVNPSGARPPASQVDYFPPSGRVYQPVYREGVVVPQQYPVPR